MASLAQRRYALQAADELLNDLGINQEEPVEVFDLIDQLGLWLVFNRLNNLLGATVPKGNGGIMLTTQRGPSVQRYTAAHEIGHWILDIDEPAFDGEDDIFHPTVDREQLAQLFAGQLLMPPPLVFATCSRHGITTDTQATGPSVYLVARDMGASYEAAARQLSNLDIISPASRDALLARTPAQVKAELCHGHRPRGAVDVWPVDLTKTGSEVTVTEGDEVIVTLPENRTTGYRWMTNEEVAARAARSANPAPAPFTSPVQSAEEVPAAAAPRPPTTRSTAAVNRALMRVPGNAGKRRILRGHDPRSGNVEYGDDNSADDTLAVGSADAESALEPLPVSLSAVDDRFTAGWARVAAAATRSVRRAIAGRRDVSLPDSLGAYLTPASAHAADGLSTSAIPVAATGERLLALQVTGSGSLGLDLTYSSAVDPRAPEAASFHLELLVSSTPQVHHRRMLLQSALADPTGHPADDDAGEPS